MTTIIGIKTTAGSVDAVVLGADTRLVYFDDNGEAIGYHRCNKLVHADGAPWIMTHSGMDTPEYRKFRRELVGTLERELQTTEELQWLTEGALPRTRVPFEPVAALFRREEEKQRDWYSRIFLATTTSDSGVPGLWYFDRKGRLRPCPNGRKHNVFMSLTAGSGGRYARRTLRSMLRTVRADSVTLKDAVEILMMGLWMAQDYYTDGYQLAVITDEGVKISPQFSTYMAQFRPYCTSLIEGYGGNDGTKVNGPKTVKEKIAANIGGFDNLTLKAS